MDKLKAPSMFVAVVFTISAVFSLISFVLKAVGGGGGGLVIFMLFTAGLLVFCAIANWVVYFRKYVDYKIENKLKEQNNE